jgi:two-component system nitrate/nitrite sensor histidine kinase NarX
MSAIRSSLQAKIIIWSFVPALLILLVVALAMFFAYQRVTQTLALERDKELTRLAAGQLAVQVNPYVQELDALARLSTISRGDAGSQQAALRHARSRLVVFDGGAVILDSRGRVSATEPERSDLIGADWSGRPYFREIVAFPAPVFSNILADGPDGANVIAVAVPVIGDQGEFRGVLLGMFQLGPTAVSALYGSIVKLQVADSRSAYLIDGAGRVIYDSDFSRIGRDVSAEPAVQQVLAGRSNAMSARAPDGSSIVTGFAPVPGTPWGLVTREDPGALAGAFREFGQFLILLLVLGVLIPAAVVTASVRRIIRPINDLIVASQEVARGNFSQAIEADTGDEIEDMARQFNQMAAQLQASYSQLEQQVTERSRALAAVNSVAEVVNRSVDLQEVLNDALAEVLEVMNFSAGGVYLLDQTSQELHLTAHQGVDEARLASIMAIKVGEGFSGQAVATGRPVVIDDLPAGLVLERFGEGGPDLHTVASFPLVASGETLGAMFVASRQRRPLSQQDIELLNAIGLQVGVAIENTHLISRQKEAAAVEERQRLARDLHDAVTQTLFSASLIADVLPRIWDRNPEEARRRLEELRQLSRGALAEMRTLLMELRPVALQDAPLGELMRQLAEAFTGRVRVPVDLVVEGGACDLPGDVKVALYRIAQEALNNVAKHAAASQVWLSLRCTVGRVILEVRDNGAGFEPGQANPNNLGLRIMRERAQSIAATLTVDSEMGEGTEVIVIWNAG